MIIMEICAVLFVAAVAAKVTGLWDTTSKVEKNVARKLMRQGIYGHFENGEFIFDNVRKNIC